MPFAGGIMQHGYQCGMIWGATLAAGAEAYRRFGSGPRAETAAILAAQRVVESFRGRHGEIDCLEITHIDKTSSTWEMINYFVIKGGTIGCFRMASWYAPLAFHAIESALAEVEAASPDTQESDESLPPPRSCAAELARRMGASEMHTVMASGLAGGIGLCGGACGALGAALWLRGLTMGKEKGRKLKYEDHLRNPGHQELIQRFMRLTDFEFECSEIVGRSFSHADDHATYLRDGGCRELIEGLADEE